ncbi:S-layer homology domain-containing protein [Paenibacillus thailandensis]|uniref:S-layer homology domain-containing protein n=1 Tax=Paenibacillus thailandensis TaxID=393250 RepID=A0ABW5QUX7_9BACL
MKKGLRLRNLVAGALTVSFLLAAGGGIPSSPVQAASEKATFKDTIPAWAKSSVETAVQAGILSGYPDGTFKPNNPITRAELLKVMALTFDLKVNTATSGAWYLPYKQALMDAKIYMANDYTGDINKSVTRNEMAKLAIRGAKAEYRGKFMTAAELMFRAVNAGLLGRTGTNADTIDTAGTTTRAQAAVLITRLLQLQNGGTLPVDKGASSAAEIAWHRHNMITMFNQNDLVPLPYTKNIDSTYDVVIEQLIILDPGDSTGYYSEYTNQVNNWELSGKKVSANDGYLFAYKLKGVSKVADSTKAKYIRSSFYMLNEGPSAGFYIPRKYVYDNSLTDKKGLYQNNATFRLNKVGASGYDFYYSFVDKDFIQSQIQTYGALPIHLEKYAKQMDKTTQFYLTEVKDRQWIK